MGRRVVVQAAFGIFNVVQFLPRKRVDAEAQVGCLRVHELKVEADGLVVALFVAFSLVAVVHHAPVLGLELLERNRVNDAERSVQHQTRRVQIDVLAVGDIPERDRQIDRQRKREKAPVTDK